MEKLINGYLKIDLISRDTFISSVKDSYEEIGIVLARDEELCNHIPIGSRVLFDSFMAKKYPVEGQSGKFDWYIHFGEIVSHNL